MAAPQAVMICIDSSKWVAEEPSLLQAQKDAIQLYCEAKFKSNPANIVGFLTMGEHYVLLPPTSDLEEIQSLLRQMSEIHLGGTLELTERVLNAQLGFLDKYCPEGMKKRQLIFVGGPVLFNDVEMKTLGEAVRGKDIAVDVISFECGKDFDQSMQTKRLDTFMAAAQNNNNSHIVCVPRGSSIRDVLLRSKVLPWSYRKRETRLPASVATLSLKKDTTSLKNKADAVAIEDVKPKEMTEENKMLLVDSELKKTPLDISPKESQENAKKKKKQTRKGKNAAAVAAAPAPAPAVAVVDDLGYSKEPEWVPRHKYEALVKECEKLKQKLKELRIKNVIT